jgi:predicted DNA-binding protein YlxM (UPF0122 family)
MVKSFGEHGYAEDIVQEMYIRLYNYSAPEKFIVDDQVNKGFVWMVLKNYCNTLKLQRSKIHKIEISTVLNLSTEETDANHFRSIEVIMDKIEQEKLNWHWYDRQLFDIYMNTNKSMRKLSQETKISTDSIFNTIKKCKKKLEKAVGEDYIDFLNQDYERI